MIKLEGATNTILRTEIFEDDKGIWVYADSDHSYYSGQCILHLVHVYDWYDYIEPVPAECIIENGKIKIRLREHLEHGLYILCYITIDGDEVVLGERKSNGFSIEAIIYVNNNVCALDDTGKKIYYDVLQRRENIFNEVKGDVENGNTLFDIYVFVKNMNVATTLYYGDIEVIPYNRYKSLSETKMIDSFFTNKNTIFDYSSTLRDGFGAVIRMKNILSDPDGKYAKKLAYERASILVNLYTISNYDNASIIAYVAKKSNDNTYSIHVNDPIYKGNLLRLADQGQTIRNNYIYLSNKDSRINAYIKLYNEAISEQDNMASYFKLWEILEIMAESNDIKGKYITYWDGTPFVNAKGEMTKISQKIDSVFELLRIKCNEGKTYNFTLMNSIEKPKDFLIVCYQRRCCYAHFGKCNVNDTKQCLSNKASCKLCRENMSFNNDKFQDTIWNMLQSCVRDFIFQELTCATADMAKKDDIVNELINQYSGN